jgi:hypothetical protein
LGFSWARAPACCSTSHAPAADLQLLLAAAARLFFIPLQPFGIMLGMIVVLVRLTGRGLNARRGVLVVCSVPHLLRYLASCSRRRLCPRTTRHTQILTETLSQPQMLLFGWRIAFLLGAFTGVVGVMLRRAMPDPAIFLQRKHLIEEQLEQFDDAGNAAVVDDRCVCAGGVGRWAAQALGFPACLTAQLCDTGTSCLATDADTILLPVCACICLLHDSAHHQPAVSKDVEAVAVKPDPSAVADSDSSLPRPHIKGKRFWPVLEMLRHYWLQGEERKSCVWGGECVHACAKLRVGRRGGGRAAEFCCLPGRWSCGVVPPNTQR